MVYALAAMLGTQPHDREPDVKKGTPDHEDVNLILRLYELRREAVMREARDFIGFQFWPQSFDDFVAVAGNLSNPKNRFWRQVATYWEMAATFVNSGALHEDLFWNTNGELFFFFAKVQPFLERFRKEYEAPLALVQVEKLIRRRPDGMDRLAMVRARQAKILETMKR